MNASLKRGLIPLLYVLIFCGAMIYYYPLLPEPMASHFNDHGIPNGWMNKAGFFMLIGGIYLAVYLTITFLLKIDPFRKKIEPRIGIVHLIRDIVLGFLIFIFILTAQGALDGKLSIKVLSCAMGLFFIALGNYLPRVPQNWFIGIRTPWTISSPTIWKKTHTVGGVWFVAEGLLLCIASVAGWDMNIIFIATLFPMILILAFVYPFYLFKKEQRTMESGK